LGQYNISAFTLRREGHPVGKSIQGQVHSDDDSTTTRVGKEGGGIGKAPSSFLIVERSHETSYFHH
jgi:hypothetical protein